MLPMPCPFSNDRPITGSTGRTNEVHCCKVFTRTGATAISVGPGQGTKPEIAFVITCVGSVTKATLRLADSSTIVTYEGPFEIVSLVGTVSGGEGGHLHISLSDSKGQVIGGHVVGDLFIYTTAEVVLGECEGVRFERAHDKETGYEELVICTEQNQLS